MVEYLVYVTMVFIPISIWIILLLRAENYSLKNISAVILLSYLVIVSFPFSMQYLGTSRTALMYALALGMLAMVLFRPLAYAFGNEALADYALPDPMDSSITGVTSAFGSRYEAACSPQDNKNVITTSAPENITVSISGVSPEDLIAVNIKKDDTSAAVEAAAALALIAAAEEFTSSSCWTDDDLASDELTEDHGLDIEMNDPSVNFISMIEDVDTAELVLMDDSSQQREPEPALLIIEDDRSEIDRINSIIEYGFKAKAEGDLEAAGLWFHQAFQASPDRELRYLLGVELVTILQSTGDYEQAEHLLDQLLETEDLSLSEELIRQKRYLGILANELEQLGIPGTPAAEIPRFVRIKVEEKMLA